MSVEMIRKGRVHVSSMFGKDYQNVLSTRLCDRIFLTESCQCGASVRKYQDESVNAICKEMRKYIELPTLSIWRRSSWWPRRPLPVYQKQPRTARGRMKFTFYTYLSKVPYYVAFQSFLLQLPFNDSF